MSEKSVETEREDLLRQVQRMEQEHARALARIQAELALERSTREHLSDLCQFYKHQLARDQARLEELDEYSAAE